MKSRQSVLESEMRELSKKARDLFNAVSSGDTRKARQITRRHGNDPRVMNYVTTDKQATALMYAAKKGFTEIAGMLFNQLPVAHQIEAIHKTDITGYTALIIATEMGHLDIITLLLNALPQNEKLNAIQHAKSDGETALIVATERNHIQIVAHLLQALPDREQKQNRINQVDRKNRSALMYAMHHGRTEITGLFLEAFVSTSSDLLAAINLTDNDGQTGLIAAAHEGHAAIVETLLNSVPQDNKLAIINHADHYGQTSLMAAAHQGHTGVVKLLLDALPEDDRLDAINHQDNNGNTALTLAMYNHHTEISDMLLNSAWEEDGTNSALRHAATGGAIELLEEPLLESPLLAPEDPPLEPPLLEGLTVFDASLAENLDHDTASESDDDAGPRFIG